MQARARATAEEEKVLNLYRADLPENYRNLPLPPGKGSENMSHFVLLDFRLKGNLPFIDRERSK